MNCVFVIDPAGGGSKRTVATRLSVSKTGWLRLWDGNRLVAVCREGWWTRCYVEAPSFAVNTLEEPAVSAVEQGR